MGCSKATINEKIQKKKHEDVLLFIVLVALIIIDMFGFIIFILIVFWCKDKIDAWKEFAKIFNFQ